MSAFTNTLSILPDDEIGKARGAKSGVKFIACFGRYFKQGSDCVVATSVEECIPRNCNAVLGPGSIGFARWLEHGEDGKLGRGTGTRGTEESSSRTRRGTEESSKGYEKNNLHPGVEGVTGRERTGSSLKQDNYMKEDKKASSPTTSVRSSSSEDKNIKIAPAPRMEEVEDIDVVSTSEDGSSPPGLTASSSEENEETEEQSAISKFSGYVGSLFPSLVPILGSSPDVNTGDSIKNLNQSTSTNYLHQHLLGGGGHHLLTQHTTNSSPSTEHQEGRLLGQQEERLSCPLHLQKTSIPTSIPNPLLPNYARFSLQRISIRLRSNPEDSVAILQTFCLIGPNVLLVGRSFSLRYYYIQILFYPR